MIDRLAMLIALAALLSGCISFPDAPAAIMTPAIDEEAVISVDGARLGLSKWEAEEPVALIIAVHGMNDYANAFHFAGPYWAARGVSVYAYDQRGFGRSPQAGRWPGADALKKDLRAVIAAVRASRPDLPVYVAGHSMGAAVILAAIKDAPLEVDGVILAAPGVWGGASLSLFYRATLNIAAGFAPGKTVTGERLGRQASDNIDFLRAMYDDPLVIKGTRMDAILGAVRIMGDAWDASDEISDDILFVYGEKDEIIPVDAMRKAARRLCGSVRTMSYPESWHLVFSDLGREKVLGDVLRWIAADIEMWRPQKQMGDLNSAVSNCAGDSEQGEPAVSPG